MSVAEVFYSLFQWGDRQMLLITLDTLLIVVRWLECYGLSAWKISVCTSASMVIDGNFVWT